MYIERKEICIWGGKKWNSHPKWKERQGHALKRVKLSAAYLNGSQFQVFDSLSPGSALTVPEPTNVSIWDRSWLRRVWSHLKFILTRSHEVSTRHDSFNLVVLSHSLSDFSQFSFLFLPFSFLFVCFRCTCHFIFSDLTLWDHSGRPALAWKCPYKSPAALFIFKLPALCIFFLCLSTARVFICIPTFFFTKKK